MEVKHIILSNGYQEWRRNDNNELHREDDLPAVICANGDQHWYVNGKRHRENDLPAIVRAHNQPAVILTVGDLMWHINGKPFFAF